VNPQLRPATGVDLEEPVHPGLPLGGLGYQACAAERWVGTVRRELLDRMLIGGRRQLEAVLAAYVTHYNDHRPHPALGQVSPVAEAAPVAPAQGMRVVRVDRLDGLIHEYAQVA